MPTDTKTRDLSSQITGSTTVFNTLPEPYNAGTLVVFVNGSRLADDCFTELSTTTFDVTLPKGPLKAGDKLAVQYEVPDDGTTLFPIIVPYASNPFP